MEIYSKVGAKFKGIGITSLAVCLMFGIYYIYLMAYCFMYMFTSLQPDLPWGHDQTTILTKTKQFYYDKILNLAPRDAPVSELATFYYPLLGSFVACWGLIYYCLRKGVELSGKIAVVTVITPYILLTVFLIRVIFLKGFSKGMWFLMMPNVEKMMDMSVWIKALEQVFFQTSIGMGVFINFSSFRKRSDPIVSPAVYLVLFNGLTGFYASMIIFGYLGHYSHIFDIPIEELQI